MELAVVHLSGLNKSVLKQYNVLLLDLRGHGESKTTLKQPLNKNIPFRL
jgi:pimeloyl-ACP methyl ester carboxylesterase